MSEFSFDEIVSTVKQVWPNFVKVLIGAALNLLIIIGQLLGMGYIYNVIKSTFENKKELPNWENWGSLFFNGLKLFYVALLYLGPSFLLLSFSLALFFSPLRFLSSLLALLALILLIPVSFVSLFGIIAVVETGSVKEGFNFVKLFEKIKANFVKAILTYVLIIIAMISLAFISSLIPFVGFLVSLYFSFYGEIVAAILFTKVYAEAK